MTDDRPAAAPHRTVHMVGNSHLDLVWLWPWQEAYQEGFEDDLFGPSPTYDPSLLSGPHAEVRLTEMQSIP